MQPGKASPSVINDVVRNLVADEAVSDIPVGDAAVS
jgi:hypothetical protein